MIGGERRQPRGPKPRSFVPRISKAKALAYLKQRQMQRSGLDGSDLFEFLERPCVLTLVRNWK